jgi:hypothetical protein
LVVTLLSIFDFFIFYIFIVIIVIIIIIIIIIVFSLYNETFDSFVCIDVVARRCWRERTRRMFELSQWRMFIGRSMPVRYIFSVFFFICFQSSN